MRSPQILVYILSDDPSARTDFLASGFDHDEFIPAVVTPRVITSPRATPLPPPGPDPSTWDGNESSAPTPWSSPAVPRSVGAGVGLNLTPPDPEWKMVRWALTTAATNSPSSCVLLIKDSSVTHADSETLSRVLGQVASHPQWDVAYLCKWQDRCDLYSDRTVVDGTMAVLARTVSPKGFQAVMVSPAGRDLLLGQSPLPAGSNGAPAVSFPMSIQGSMEETLSTAVAQGQLL